MSIKHIGVEVKISRRTMWVDSKVYPLAHVTRVEPFEITPRRRRILAVHGRRMAAWAGLGLLGLMALSCAGEAVPSAVVIGFVAVVLAGLVLNGVRLIRRLTTDTLYVLRIAIAGTSQAVVAS